MRIVSHIGALYASLLVASSKPPNLHLTYLSTSIQRSFSGWQTGRIFPNEKELILGISKTILDWNDGACFRARKEGCRDKMVVFELQVWGGMGLI